MAPLLRFTTLSRQSCIPLLITFVLYSGFAPVVAMPNMPTTTPSPHMLVQRQQQAFSTGGIFIGYDWVTPPNSASPSC